MNSLEDVFTPVLIVLKRLYRNIMDLKTSKGELLLPQKNISEINQLKEL